MTSEGLRPPADHDDHFEGLVFLFQCPVGATGANQGGWLHSEPNSSQKGVRMRKPMIGTSVKYLGLLDRRESRVVLESIDEIASYGSELREAVRRLLNQ